MSFDPVLAEAHEVAAAVRSGALSARAVVEAHLARIAKHDAKLGAYTAVLKDRALVQADGIDAKRARGDALGELAGVTFAVKNLFDVAGLPTLAGSKINAEHVPKTTDAFLVRQLIAQDAILLGALNMGEYAYDFTGENQHYGPSRNPHDPDHMSGGSSGGSGTSVAAGMAHLSLGSDTNGSIRVPSSFCGLFGLKPTYGRLSRGGSYPFVASFDHLGPLARSPMDLALSYDAMQGADPHDPMQAKRPASPVSVLLHGGLAGLRIASLQGYFATGATADAYAAVAHVAEALGTDRKAEILEAARARAAAYLITMTEGASLHLDQLRTRAGDYDLDVRDRLIAGAMVPGIWVDRAQKFRRWYRDEVMKLFQDVDVLLAPSTPLRAPRIGQKMMTLDGVDMPVRANIGIFTQPISFIGLPVVSVPVWTKGERLPIGVQVITAPWREDHALRVAQALATSGACRAPVAALD
jgi:AtzE family amidohydrolase